MDPLFIRLRYPIGSCIRKAMHPESLRSGTYPSYPTIATPGYSNYPKASKKKKKKKKQKQKKKKTQPSTDPCSF